MNERKKVFNRVVNPLLLKYLAPISESALAKDIPIKYLNYFKEITGSGNGGKSVTDTEVRQHLITDETLLIYT